MQQGQASHPRTHPVADLLTRVSRKLRGNARAQIIGRIALSIFAICVDIRVVPTMYSARPFFTLGAFAILVWGSDKSREKTILLPRLSAARLMVFACLHLVLMYVGDHFAPGLSSIAQSDSTSAPLAAAAKILLALPTVVLFPIRSEFFPRFASEIAAAAIVLFTFFPDRYFQLIWPWYSRVLTTGAALVCSVFVPGTHLDVGTLTLIGPSVDMVVDFTCSGITGMNLFHLVFGFVVIVEWNRLNKRRALICYVVGGLAYVVANFIRLNLLFLIGNLISADINLDFLGWVLFAVTFYILIKLTYDWMMESEKQSKAITVRGQVDAA